MNYLNEEKNKTTAVEIFDYPREDKDEIIKSLKEENEILKSRLEEYDSKKNG